MRSHAKAVVAISAMLLTLALGATIASALAPVVTIEDAENVTYTTADVKGTVDPDGQPTTYRFQYIGDAQFQENLANSLPGFEGAATGIEESTEVSGPVAGQFTGLAPATTYHLRLHAENADGESDAVAASTFTTDTVVKPSVSIDPVATFTATTAHFSGEVSPNGTDPAFDTSWTFECTPACPGLQGGSITADETDHEVEVDAKGLEPNTEYTVTLRASNLGGEETDQTTFTTPAVGPTVKASAAGPIQAKQVSINGQVNPHNSPTTYWFEWGTEDCSANPCQSLPVSEDAAAGSGGLNVYVSEQLTGLEPETTYHFRLVAKNATGTTVGDDVEFTTAATPATCSNDGALGSGFLPDCRAWEMVSPPDKNGSGVIGHSSWTRAAVDGDAVSYASLAAFGDAAGVSISTQYLAKRDPSAGANGWATHAISPAQGSLPAVGLAPLEVAPKYIGEFSPDLDKGVFRSYRAIGSAPNVEGVPNFYLRDDLLTPGAGHYQLLTDSASLQTITDEPTEALPYISDASADFSHITFESKLNLTANATGTLRKLYEWADGTTRLVGIKPDGSAAASSQPGFHPESHYSQRSMSADGSRIFVVLASGGAGDLDGELLLRIDGSISIPIGASERDVPLPAQEVSFWGTSDDGRRAFFSTSQSLMDDDEPSNGTDLYMWEQQPSNERQSVAIDASGGTFKLSTNAGHADPTFQATTSSLAFDSTAAEVQAALGALPTVGAGNVVVSGGPGASAPYLIEFTGDLAGINVDQLAGDASELSGGAESVTVTTPDPVENLTRLSVDRSGKDSVEVRNVVGTSDDGNYVYFSAQGQLVPGATPESQWPADPQGRTNVGLYLWHDGDVDYIGAVNRVATDLNGLDVNYRTGIASRVTPDGKHLLFTAHTGDGLAGQGGFAGYDHGNTCTQDNTFIESRCRGLYVYAADSGRLTCASCNANKPAAEGDALVLIKAHVGATTTTFPSTYGTRNVSNNGRYVFFTTEDALAPEGADTNGKKDAYRYDTATREVALLSSGTDPNDSYFLEASATGRDAFFMTRERLSSWDQDGAYDLYDARIGGGVVEPRPQPASCGGDSCRPSPSGAPSVPSVSSASFSGPGDRPPSRGCPKGKRRVKTRGGKARCVRRSQKTRKSQKRDSNKRGRAGR